MGLGGPGDIPPPCTHPWVVEAVTLTTMMVALVRICCRFSLFLHLSRLLPSSWGLEGKRGEVQRLRKALDPLLLLHLPGSLLGTQGQLVSVHMVPASSGDFTAQSTSSICPAQLVQTGPGQSHCPHQLRVQT